MIFLLLLPILLLISGPDWISAGIGAALYLVSGIFLNRKLKGQTVRDILMIRLPIPTMVCSVALSARFYFSWGSHPFFASWEVLPTMPARRICGIFAAALGFLALFGVDRILSVLLKRTGPENGEFSPAAEYTFIGLSSALIVSLVSRCSPFYAFNDWVDPHTMFNVGKGILHGMVPYRDIYEQKGPLILAVHALGALISFDSFTGIWLIEIVSCFWFLFYAYRIMKVRMGQQALLLIPILALSTFSAVSFEQGDSAEEFGLPILMYALYVGIRCLREDELPTRREWIFIGISSGWMLWTKYSTLGFYIGWIIAVYLFAASVARKAEVLRGIGWVAAGVGIITAPVLLWFGIAGALSDLFEVYFYENMFLYPKTADLYGNFALFKNLGNGILNFAFFSTFLFVTSLLGFIWISRHEKRSVFRLVLFSYISLFLLMYFSGRFYSYYSLIFGSFSIFGIAGIYDFFAIRLDFDRLAEDWLRTGVAGVMCACIAGSFVFSGNMRSLAYTREDYPQYKIAELIEASGIAEPTLMNYGFLDMGADTAAGIIPSQRFFCSFNLPLDQIEIDQKACLDSGCVDFVMTFMLKIDSPNYELAGKFDSLYNFAGIIPQYNLYRRIDK